MAKYRIKCGDTVKVIAGKEKGRMGSVIRIDTERSRVLVEGLNMVKRHVRPQGGQPGQVVEKEASIHISNVALWNSDENRAVRVGYQVQDGNKVRVDRKTGAALDS